MLGQELCCVQILAYAQELPPRNVYKKKNKNISSNAIKVMLNIPRNQYWWYRKK